MTNSSEHLLLVSIGPVQDFIAAARKCQDLWFGSWLLSDLSRATAVALRDAAGPNSLIFPPNVDDASAIANKILLRVPGTHKPRDVAERGRTALKERLELLRNHIFGRLPTPGPDTWNQDIAIKQVNDLLEYQWVIAEYGPSRPFAEARAKAEQRLAERKNTRSWSVVPWELPHVPKSALDGLRESVISEQLYDDVQGSRLKQAEFRRRYFVKPKERLCGVGILKRCGQALAAEYDDESTGPLSKTPAFHSNSHIASSPLLKRLHDVGIEGEKVLTEYFRVLQDDAQVDLGRFLIRQGTRHHALLSNSLLSPPDTNKDSAGTVSTISVRRTYPVTEIPGAAISASRKAQRGFDGYLLFEDRLPDVIAESSSLPEDKWADAVKKAQSGLRDVLKALDVKTPPAYYAMIFADGDSVGKAFETLAARAPSDNKDEYGDVRGVKKLSTALDGFAQGASKLIEENSGSLIYAGGDDCMALVPLHTLLQCVRKLSDAFNTAVKPFENSLDVLPSLSVGVAIVHHLEPFVDARELAMSAERLAKKKKNSLAIILSKRSGATLKLASVWTDKQPLDQRLLQWMKLLHHDELPDGVAYEIERIVPLLARDYHHESNDAGLIRKLASQLVLQVLSRKRADRGTRALSETTLNAVRSRILEAENVVESITKLSEEIQVARLLLSAHEVAWRKA